MPKKKDPAAVKLGRKSGKEIAKVGACDAGNSIPMTLLDVAKDGTVNWQTQITSTTPGVCPPTVPKMAVGQDGAVIVSNVVQVSPALVILDGLSGATISAPPIPASTFTNSMGQPTSCDCFSIVGQPMVDSDGSIDVEYEVRQVQFFIHGGSTTTSSAVSLLQIAPDYTTTSTVQLGTATFADLFPATVIPDGQGGEIATWSMVDTLNTNTGTTPTAPNPYEAAQITTGAVVATYPLPGASPGVVPPFGPDGLPVAPSMVLGNTGTNTVFVSLGQNVTSFQIDSGSLNWKYQSGSGVGLLAATIDGGTAINDSVQGLLHVDTTGAAAQIVTPSSLSDLTYSWTGGWTAVTNAGSQLSSVASLIDIDPANRWPTIGGSPSGNGASGALCECLRQSADTDSGQSAIASLPGHGAAATELNSVAAASVHTTLSQTVCPICYLPSPQPTLSMPLSCQSSSGTGPTYMLLVADPGLTGHDVLDLFEASAQTEFNLLQGQGNHTIACRVSSRTDVLNALTMNGFIDGGAMYFGHSGLRGDYVNGVFVGSTEIFVGQNQGADTNIASYNVSSLSYIQTGNGGTNFMGPSAAMRLFGCNTSYTIPNDTYNAAAHYFTSSEFSIAELLAGGLNRGVYGYEVGMYFGVTDIQHDPWIKGVDKRGKPRKVPDQIPMYMIPEGTPGRKPNPLSCRPNAGHCTAN